MMKKSPLIILFVGVFIVLIFGCKQPAPTGKRGSHARISEVLVVMDKSLWESELGDSVKEALGQFYPYLNQPQPMFSYIFRTPAEFDETYTMFRNILHFVLEPEMSGGKILKEIDYWAKPQTVIQLSGNNKETLKGLFDRNKEAVIKLFNESEVRRLKGVMQSISNVGYANQIAEQLDVKIAVPDGFYIATKLDNFVWARKIIKSKTQETSYWITTVPYTDTAQFSPENILAMRDSVCKTYIPVQDEESYMGTEYRFGYQNKVIRLNGNYAIETRGFWRTYGNFSMGGPFINFLIHDEKNGRLIMVDGYVFKPNEDKRDLVRQLEGIVHTISF